MDGLPQSLSAKFKEAVAVVTASDVFSREFSKVECHDKSIWMHIQYKEDPDQAAPEEAVYLGTFAYKTIKDRLPIILTKVADTGHRSKSWIKEKYGQEAPEDLKAIVGCISKLRNEVQTNKPLIPIQDSRTDVKIWNDYLREVTEKEGQPPTWFVSPWLYVECYMYRRIHEAVELSSCLQRFDVFGEQKEKALTDSTQAVLTLMNYLMTVVDDLNEGKATDVHKLFIQLTQVSLWGNKCDLSISAGLENSQTSCPLDQVNTLREYILLDNLEKVWSKLQESEPSRVDIVLDNAGFEFATDLCLAEFLISAKLANCVHFHGKAFPWFVSDVTKTDLDHTFQLFQQSNSLAMNRFTTKWQERFREGSWKFEAHNFWTLPFAYSNMKKYAPDLYQDLGKSRLVIFKGDLNFRKLVGDLDWPPTTPFTESLRGFHPAPLLSLRALKANVVTGLKEGQAEEVGNQDEDWLVNGCWATMAFCDKIVP